MNRRLTSHSLRTLLAGVSASTLFPTVALAQQTALPPPLPANEADANTETSGAPADTDTGEVAPAAGGRNEDIIVTAQKRAQNAQNVPMRSPR